MTAAPTVSAPTVTERLVAFMRAQSAAGPPAAVRLEARRLILNQLKASVGAAAHPAVRILADHARAEGTGDATALWLGAKLRPAQAALVNGALFEVLDFHDTYIPCFMHAVSGVLPAVLALAEAEGSSGADLVDALAIGIEVELAVATILMPTGYFRGAVPAGLTGGVGAAAACAVLAKLDAGAMRDALGIAMCTAFGLYASVGSMTLGYITGATARSGLTAFDLARRGLDAPATAFEGDKGMLQAQSDEDGGKIDGVLASLGSTWRIFGQTYKVVPTETITHGPVECVLAVLPRAGGRTIDRMTFAVSPIVVTIADERRDRFGAPRSEDEARFDLRHCAAAAWVRRTFWFEEMHAPAFTDPAILDLRDRVDLVADAARPTFEGCGLVVTFTDGTTESHAVDHFLGTPGAPVDDDHLAALFHAAAAGLMPATQADAIVAAVHGLSDAPDVRGLTALTVLPGD